MTEMFFEIIFVQVEDRLTAKSWNRENLLEGTSVACQIIGFGHHNSAQTQGDACGQASVSSREGIWFLASTTLFSFNYIFIF